MHTEHRAMQWNGATVRLEGGNERIEWNRDCQSSHANAQLVCYTLIDFNRRIHSIILTHIKYQFRDWLLSCNWAWARERARAFNFTGCCSLRTLNTIALDGFLPNTRKKLTHKDTRKKAIDAHCAHKHKQHISSSVRHCTSIHANLTDNYSTKYTYTQHTHTFKRT